MNHQTPSRTDLSGLEFDWYAVDGRGQLARFSTGGEGTIPQHVLDNLEVQEAIANEVSATLGHHKHFDLLNEAKVLANAGVFSFDWRRATKCYECLIPFSAHSRPFQIAPALRHGLVPFLNADFTAQSALSIPPSL